MNGYEKENLAVVNAFMATLHISGYDEAFRRETALSAYQGIATMLGKESLGERKLYRL